VIVSITRNGQRVAHVEDIQDQVELAMMRAGEHVAARTFVLARETRRIAREKNRSGHDEDAPMIHILMDDGEQEILDVLALGNLIKEACKDLDDVDAGKVVKETLKNAYDNMSHKDLQEAMILAARSMIDHEPNYGFVTARLLLAELCEEALTFMEGTRVAPSLSQMSDHYAEYFPVFIKKGIELDRLDKQLEKFDLKMLADAIRPERDFQFTYLGMQTIYDRYLLHEGGIRYELPQALFMRVAMGLALEQDDVNEAAIRYYDLLSSFDYMTSTPTLFNSGTIRSQLSSCYLTTVPDHLEGIYDAIKDNALLSKFAGGLGNDWTPVRGMGSHIKGTNGQSQGVVPFLKVANDTLVAVNQGGKRKGSGCAYLETWHIDVEDFLELRKNTGDERRRTHDMNTANWIPDLFMKRVSEEGEWTLFSPEEVPELHDAFGDEFVRLYEAYEDKARLGKMQVTRTIKAVDLWRKMLTMLFETGHPWIAFKDPCTARYTNQHVGTVHSSNLCTEITLHTNEGEIAVCNLGSVNLVQHLKEDGSLDTEKLERTINTALEMLDNVIDLNYYSVDKAMFSNIQHRPVGLGQMGFQQALQIKGMPYDSEDAVNFADYVSEAISYFAIKASHRLAKERGSYMTFDGSLWSQGILPIDSQKLLAATRDDQYAKFDMNESGYFDWNEVRELVKEGMRNSNIMAIAPTATISNICGVSQSIEPTYQNLYVKSNLSGEFTVVNHQLVNDLKARGLWDEVMVLDLKSYDGSVQHIARIPDDLKALYKTAFEIDPRWLVEAGARRQKWIDQAQSLNLYMAEPSGKKLDQLYKLAWVRGLKTTYYLRSLGATGAEKTSVSVSTVEAPKACSIDDPSCESCQ
jgi:ribonucleoside-diphosphate reductase alpha chain